MPSTKPRIRAYISIDNYIRLQALGRKPGFTESQVVDHALAAYFAGEHEVKRDAALIRRLDRMTRASEVLKRNQMIAGEAFALFIRYFLTVIPPVPEADKQAAKAQGHARFERYLQNLQRILQDGESILFTAIEDRMAEESAFFTKEELLQLRETAREGERPHA